MKNLQQFLQPHFMFIKTKWVFAIVFSITTVMIGCKKEFQPSGSDETLNQETRTTSSKSKAPDIIVHAGGSIQGAVDAAPLADRSSSMESCPGAGRPQKPWPRTAPN